MSDTGEIVCESDIIAKTLPVSELRFVAEIGGEVVDDVALCEGGFGKRFSIVGSVADWEGDCWHFVRSNWKKWGWEDGGSA